jgi:coenzyme Q-binding protein COQ10
MPTHVENRILPYTPQQLFELITDVERYPAFLPCVVSAQISKKEENHFLADVVVGYKLISYPYHCRVHLIPDQRIDIEYLHGPFKHLYNHWALTPLNEKLTQVDFYIDFEFKTLTLQMLFQPLFSEIVNRMISSFEGRAAQLY